MRCSKTGILTVAGGETTGLIDGLDTLMGVLGRDAFWGLIPLRFTLASRRSVSQNTWRPCRAACRTEK